MAISNGDKRFQPRLIPSLFQNQVKVRHFRLLGKNKRIQYNFVASQANIRTKEKNRAYVFIGGRFRPPTNQVAPVWWLSRHSSCRISSRSRPGRWLDRRRPGWWWCRCGVLDVLNNRGQSLGPKLALVVREVITLGPGSQGVPEAFQKILLRCRGGERPAFTHGVGFLHGGVGGVGFLHPQEVLTAGRAWWVVRRGLWGGEVVVLGGYVDHVPEVGQVWGVGTVVVK